MAKYIVSDGIDSQEVEAATPQEAAAIFFDPADYDWGDYSPNDDSIGRYDVWLKDKIVAVGDLADAYRQRFDRQR